MNLRESPPLRLGLCPSHLSPVNGGEDTPAGPLPLVLAPTKWGRGGARSATERGFSAKLGLLQ